MDMKQVPSDRGIYVVLRADPSSTYELLVVSPIEKRAPYPLDDLESRWHVGATVVYIGKAGGAGGLRQRLRPFSRKKINHSGGRSIWQLAEAETLLVCWQTHPNATADEIDAIETAWIASFKAAHGGRRPFANRNK